MARSKDRLGDYHAEFADKIIEQIKAGTAPFQKSWKPEDRALPEKLRNGEPYRGGNSLRLQVEAARRGYADSRWGTYNQIKAAGGHVKRGEKGTRILAYFQQRPAEDDPGRPKLNDAGEPVHTRVARRYAKVYNVFNAEQTGGLPARRQAKQAPEWQVHEKAQAIIDASGVDVRHQAGDRAFYRVSTDQVVLPEPAQFPTARGYYQTALHELGHATGHPERLDRDTLGKPHGSPDYAREELRAEIAAMMTGDRIGLGHEPRNGVAYVASWVQALEDNPREINDAAIDAEKISTYLIERERSPQREQETSQPARAEDREPGQDLTPAPAPQAAPDRQQADFNRNVRLAAAAALDGLSDRNGRALRVEEGRPPDQLIRGLKTVRAAAARNLHDPQTANFSITRRMLHDHAVTNAHLTPAQREALHDLADNFGNQAQDHGLRDFKRLDIDQALADLGQPAPDHVSDHATAPDQTSPAAQALAASHDRLRPATDDPHAPILDKVTWYGHPTTLIHTPQKDDGGQHPRIGTVEELPNGTWSAYETFRHHGGNTEQKIATGLPTHQAAVDTVLAHAEHVGAPRSVHSLADARLSAGAPVDHSTAPPIRDREPSLASHDRGRDRDDGPARG